MAADAANLPRGWPPSFNSSARERPALLVLACLRGISPSSLRGLAWRDASPSDCLDAVRAGRGGSEGDRRWIGRARAEEIERALVAGGARFVAACDPEYPRSLTDLHDPPGWLFVRGARIDADEARVAIVGSRRCSALGREVALGLGRGLAANGVCVVSGAAYGIDAAAHRGALAAAGRTIAVLGSGIDVPYPKASRDLIRSIASAGSLVSEYGPGTPPEPHRFPARNRIVAGLSRALVVVEGAAGSGSRISVDRALDLGREVFAIPGPVTSPLSEVPLELVRDGATMIRGADDLLEDLGLARPSRSSLGPPVPLPPQERAAWDALLGPSLPDAVARHAGISIPDAVSALIRLELRGLVRGTGGRYERTLARVGGTDRDVEDEPPAETGGSRRALEPPSER